MTNVAMSVADLPAAFAALQARVQALEEAIGTRAEPEHEPIGDYVETFCRNLHKNLDTEVARQGSSYGVAVVNIIAQYAHKGSQGTAYSVVTVDREDELASDEKIGEIFSRVAPLVADPLVLRVLREFVRMRFQKKPMRGSATELGALLGETPERVTALLQPLVEKGTIARGLTPEGESFYHWDGNNHAAMTLLFRG